MGKRGGLGGRITCWQNLDVGKLGEALYLSKTSVENTQVLSVKEIHINVIIQIYSSWLGLSCMGICSADNLVHVFYKGVVAPEGALHLVNKGYHMTHLSAHAE